MTHPSPPTTVVRVAVYATDAVTGAGAAAFVREHDGFDVVDPDDRLAADIGLVLTHAVSGRTAEWLEELVGPDGHRRLVLVAVGISQDLVATTDGALIATLPREQTRHQDVVEAVGALHAHEDDVEPDPPPRTLHTWLVHDLVEGSRTGPDAEDRVDSRDVELLGFLAEGLSTDEVARRLQCSERTVKNRLYAVMRELGVRTRTQAVAHALRTGLIW